MARVGIYLRISEDKDGQQTATERQRADCERFASSRGWEVAEVFEDIDLSAYRNGVKRPEFERMLGAVRMKAIDGVLAWKMDRITRRQRDLVRLDEACEAADGFIATVVENIDTRQPAGRFVAELLVAQARMESENQSIRLRRKAEELVRQGKPQAGGTRMFGYSKDRMLVIPEEAALIREAVQRVYAGEGLRGICMDWRRRGVQTPTGGAWQQITLKRLLLSAALSGQREHRARHDPNATLTAGNWPAILTPEDTHRLRLILNDPQRVKNHAGNARSYLLSGFLRCGRCGEPMVARPREDHVRRYVCARQPGRPSCGQLARLAEPSEELVREEVCIALDGADLREYMERPCDATADLLEAIKGDEERLQALAIDYADGAITRAEWFAARDRLNGRLDANRERLAKSNGHGMVNTIIGAGDEVRRQWPARGLDWQRTVIGAVVDYIVIEPALKGRNFFDPSLVRIVWKF